MNMYANHHIPDGELIAGEIPSKQLKMVLAWIAIHS
jgi:Domain of unknown function (DUF4160)